MAYAVAQGVLTDAFQAILQDLHLATHVHQEAANKYVAGDVHVGAIKCPQKLMKVDDDVQHVRRVINVRHPLPVYQRAVSIIDNIRRKAAIRPRCLD